MKPAAPEAYGHITKNIDDDALFAKLDRHLLPLLFICYVIACLDRINIGFAQLQMKQTLAFSDEVYAFGAGIFYLGYFLFEVPCNLALERIGARKTLLRIMVCWGLCAAALMFVQTALMFYLLRFLLGAFEAGFLPGVILYLTYWYPAARRGRAIAIFMTGAAFAYLIAGPSSGFIMKYLNGWMGFHGWQWMFVVQGLPAVVLGLVAYRVLRDKPEQADWLTAAEKASLRDHLDNDTQSVSRGAHSSFAELLRDSKIHALALTYVLLHGAHYAMVFWAPALIKSWGVADLFAVGLLSALPALFGVVGMVMIGRSSDRHLERRRHFLLCCTLAAAGILVTIVAQGHLIGSLAGLCLMGAGQAATTPMFFTAISEYIPKKTAAGGIALISSLGNLGPAAMPSVTTWINATTGTPVMSMWLVIGLYLTAGIILIAVLRPTAANCRAGV